MYPFILIRGHSGRQYFQLYEIKLIYNKLHLFKIDEF